MRKIKSPSLNFTDCEETDEDPKGLCITEPFEVNGWYGNQEYRYLQIKFGPCADVTDFNDCAPREEAIEMWFAEAKTDINFLVKKILIDQSVNQLPFYSMKRNSTILTISFILPI